MANNPLQKLVLLTVDPSKTQDLTSVLEKMDWWSEDWTIQQASVAPYGNQSSHVFVTVLLNKEREGDSSSTPPPSPAAT